MLKTISAALLAVSVLAAPALAAESGKTAADAPVIKTMKTSQVRTTRGKITHVKPVALNANAKMGRHHQRKHLSSHHRHHGKMAAMKTTQPRAHAKAMVRIAPKV